MKKNVVMLVLDSVTYENTLKNSGKDCPMPFLNSLIKDSLEIKNMYSEAPFTEAALVSLLTGDNTLDKTGHMKRNKNHKTIFEYFKENGYLIYSNAYQPAIYPSGQMIDFKNRFYNFPFLFSQVWDYRLKYFSEVNNTQKLSEDEIDLVIEILDDNFKTWLKYFADIKKKDKSIELIYDALDLTNIDISEKEVKEEYNNFKKDKKNYTFNLLDKKNEHELFKIQDYYANKKMGNDETKKEVTRKYKKFVRKILIKNMLLNLRNNRLSFTVIKNFIKAKEYDKIIRYFLNYCNAVIDRDLMSRIKGNFDEVKLVPSLYTMLDHFINWEDSRVDKKTPFFAYIHAEDNHFPETFFTYDVDNIELIDKEMREAYKYLKTINNKYKGSVAYDLSLRYADNCIKDFFDKLEKSNKLDDTVVVITADHGFSYYYNPIRENFVINYYKETYNVPILFYSKELKHKKLDGYYMTKDILPTILDLAHIKTSNDSILNFEGRDYSLIEFMGGGCPHYYRRNIVLGVRTDNYSVVLQIPYNDFDKYTIVSCYNLKDDKYEKNNLIYSKIDKNKIKYELEIIKNRFLEIQEQINKYKNYKV